MNTHGEKEKLFWMKHFSVFVRRRIKNYYCWQNKNTYFKFFSRDSPIYTSVSVEGYNLQAATPIGHTPTHARIHAHSHTR
jgi:hypothetical protein